MANKLYPKWGEALLQFTAGADLDGQTVKAALLDTGTVAYNSAHDFYDDISAGVGGTPVEITTKTYTAGVFDGDNVTFTSVAGTVTYEAIVIFCDTGVPGTSRLVAYIDTGVTGLPVTSNGGNITVTWDNAGIFTITP